MKFNNYIWSLYREYKQGKKDIALFKNNDFAALVKNFDFLDSYEYEDENGKVLTGSPYREMKVVLNQHSVKSFSSAYEVFYDEVVKYVKNEHYNIFIEFIHAYSTAFYHKFPEFFIPYYFNSNTYPDFLRLCENFEINLPPNPPRYDWVKRTLYYFELCKTLHKFREKHKIEPKEFPAFLYFFGMNSLEKRELQDLPKPSRVYFLGAGASGGKESENYDFQFLDDADQTSTETWGAGNLNIKKGDLVLMYCVSPRKYLHSIWRATDDSFIDPFRYHYYAVRVKYPHKFKPVTYQQLKENEILKRNPTIRSNMQGMNGRPLSVSEYEELEKLIQSSGENTEKLPKLPVYQRNIDHIENERDVEEKLIEPLLIDLGISDKDWIRQLPLKMGRKISYYPDYAIFVETKKGHEKAKIILEAKYSISNDQQLQDAFEQARTYALRLNSKNILIADREFLWVYKKNKEDFTQNHLTYYNWDDLTNPDKLYELKTLLLTR